MATRRQFLERLALGLAVAACQTHVAQPAEKAVYVGVETSATTGLSTASFFSASGSRVSSIYLGFRAHGFAQQGNHLVVFPRRPGNRFAIIDLDSFEILGVVTAPKDRHFYGHGAFTADGRTFLATENNLASLGGSIGVYELDRSARRVGEIDLPLAGPHEIVRAGPSDRFLIALGGLQTHPDYRRAAFNLPTFRSQVISLNFESRTFDAFDFWSGTEGVSLRHLAMDDKGRIYVGGQKKDMARARTAQVAWYVDGQVVKPIEISDLTAGYVSSVAARGKQALITSKETGRLVHLDGDNVLRSEEIVGASAAALGDPFGIVSGYETLWIGEKRVGVRDGQEFDNHGLLIKI